MTDPTTHDRTFTDGPWSVAWNTYPDQRAPIMLSIEHPDSLDDWDAITVSLTIERAMMLRLAIDRALGELAAKPAPPA